MFPQGLVREYASALSFLARCIDVFCVLLGGLWAYYLRFGDFSLPQGYQILVLLGVALVLIIFPLSGIYLSWRGSRWLHQARVVSVAWAATIFSVISLGFLTKIDVDYSRLWLLFWLLLSWFLLLSFRLSLHIFLRMMREKGWNKRRVIVVGAGGLGQRVVENIQAAAWTGFEVVAILDVEEKFRDKSINGISVYIGLQHLSRLLQHNTVDEVLIALPLSQNPLIDEVLYEMRHSTVNVKFVPDIMGLRLINHSITEFAGFPVLNLTESPMSGINKFIKLAEDKLVALFILMVTSPLMLLIAMGVKLSSSGPVLYRQERISWNGRPFTMFKFRTMEVDTEHHTGPVWANGRENRATPFGTFLRRTSLDELPQFINVLKGDMSVVGPRPERPYFVEKYKDKVPDYMKKHLVKAGITGWAQINGWRGDTCLKTRIEYDLFYVEHWSLWFDIKIMALTIFKGFVHKNAY